MKTVQFKNRAKLIIGLLLLLFAVACSPTGNEPELENEPESTEQPDIAEPEATEPEEKTIYISAEQVDCVGVAPQKCLLVKESPDEEYSFFYDTIAGFEWEAGFEYELVVAVSEVENPPADASSLSYELVEVVSKTAVPQPEITDITWSLLHTIVGGDAFVPVPDGASVHFQIDGDMVSGFSGCNNFSGTVEINGRNISFGPLATTRKACSEPIMTLETNLLSILADATSFSVSNNMLTLNNADDLPVATFVAAEVRTLFVGAEEVDCVGVAPQTCLLVKENRDDEYTFFYDNIVGFEWEAGFEYELRVNVTEVAEPLADASSLRYTLVEVVEKTAVSTDETSSENPELIGTVWQWIRFDDTGDINNIIVENPASYTIEFLEDGMYVLQNDCNSGGGSYTLDGEGLIINPGITTLAACGEGSLDSKFNENLMHVVTYVLADGQLFLNLKVDAGNMVFAPAE